MMSLRKLQRLPGKTRLRKAVLLLQQAEVAARRGEAPDLPFLASLLGLLKSDPGLETETKSGLEGLEEALTASAGKGDAPIRTLNRARHLLLACLKAEPAEWDLLLPEAPALDAGHRQVAPITVYLEEIRSPYNLGAIFRTAESFGVQEILLSPGCPSPLHPRAVRTSRLTETALPWRVAPLSELEGRPGLFALELGGAPVERFPFPPEGTVLVGSEELGLSPEALRLADSGAGRVSIPLAGAKRSLNVAVAFGILLHAWWQALG